MPDTPATINDAPESLQVASQWRKPEDVLKEAAEAARALQGVIAKKPKKVMFNGEQYLEAEDWQMIAYFYGCTPQIIRTEFVDYGEAGQGFEATAVLMDRFNHEVCRADAMCLNSEEQWGMVAEYEWRDKLGPDGKKLWDEKGGRNGVGAYIREKVKVGERPKPLFQLRSMAQTRATAKVINTKFRWVAVLAGYGATPAEELTNNETDMGGGDQGQGQQTQGSTTSKGVAVPQRKSEKGQEPPTTQKSSSAATPPPQPTQKPQAPAPQQQQGDSGVVLINEKQQKMLYAVSRSAGYDNDGFKRVLKEKFGVEHTRDILAKDMDAALRVIDPECKFHTPKKQQPAPPPPDEGPRYDDDREFNQAR